ncbi:MAG: hypothetical protein QOD42_1176 [Sphingomonadales bacterium]|nr:hypothetical protein [Sphingomonadales bacterium]
MKAATIARYGSPGAIALRDVPAPVPGPDEGLVRVHAASVNRSDCGELLHPILIRLLSGSGRSRRNILGMDFAGTVAAVGAAVSLFRPGDRVFGMCPARNDGAQAEYFRMPETGPIAPMPGNLRFDQAVLCEGAFYANASVEQLGCKPGHRVLIYGASGAIGTAATSTSCSTRWESSVSAGGGDCSSPEASSRRRIAAPGRRICCSSCGRRSREAGGSLFPWPGGEADRRS